MPTWNEVPFDIQCAILRAVNSRSLDKDRGALRLLGRAFAAELKFNAWEQSDDATVVVKGILALCQRHLVLCAKGASTWDLKSSPLGAYRYETCYTRVYELATYKPPKNRSKELYWQLRQQAPLRAAELPPGDVPRFHRLVCHIFKYLDAFYIPRLKLPSLRESFPY